MICPVLADISYSECLQWLEKSAITEIRLDKLSLTADEVASLFGCPNKKIATCRPGTMDEEERGDLLKHAISCGATFVDLELESYREFGESVARHAARSGCRIIISYHNFDRTPPREELLMIINRCRALGADISKIACQVLKKEDMARLLGLYDEKEYQDRLISIGMGPEGKLSRILAPFLGSPFTYASISSGKQTADGQMSVLEMEEILSGIKNVK